MNIKLVSLFLISIVPTLLFADFRSSGGPTKDVAITDGPNLDSFDRLRVSEPETLFDSKQDVSSKTIYWDTMQISGSGTNSVHSTNTSSSELSVSALTAGAIVRQTKMRFNYQPGKSQLVLITGNLSLSGGGGGITSRMGYFGNSNGIYLQLKNGTTAFVLRSSTGVSISERVVYQSSWSIDKLDGTGASRHKIDLTKSNILVIDFEWLGVGRVRIGFVMDGDIVYCHEFLNSNRFTSTYMSTPNQPIRYEISNDGTGQASTMAAICSSVVSEGGANELGTVRSTSTTNVQVDANVIGTLYAVLGIRLKQQNLQSSVKIITASMFSGTNDNFEWSLWYNPTVAGTFTYNDQQFSTVQTARGATENTVTGGIMIQSGFSGGSSAISTIIDNSIRLGSKIDGTPDEFVLCVRPLSSNADIFGTLAWRESK